MTSLVPQNQENTLVKTEASKVAATVQAQVVMAKQYIRDEVTAEAKVIQACKRPSLAEKAVYALPVGGQTIRGPSIRLAEEMARAWGNMTYGLQIIEQTKERSVCRAYAWDLENNLITEESFVVEHKRYTKSGTYNITNPQEIQNMIYAYGARRKRQCIISMIPRDIVDAAVEQCRLTMTKNTPVNADAIQKLTQAYGKIGVTPVMLEKKIGHSLEKSTADTLSELREIFTAIKDGDTSVQHWFEPEKVTATIANDLNEKMGL